MTVETQHRPHPQVIAISRLAENLAPAVTAALDHIRHELANTTLGAASPDGTGSRTSSTNHEGDQPPTTTERGAARRLWLTSQRTQIHDDITAIARIIYSCQDTCRNVYAGPELDPPNDKPRCWTGDLDGYNVPIIDGGWSDPTCTNVPRAGQTGPCDACYQRHLRYRRRSNLKPLASEVPSA